MTIEVNWMKSNKKSKCGTQQFTGGKENEGNVLYDAVKTTKVERSRQTTVQSTGKQIAYKKYLSVQVVSSRKNITAEGWLA